MGYWCVMSDKECDGCMECKETPTPVTCDVCGIEIEEYMYVIDGECLCKTCLDDIYKQYLEEE